MTEVNYAELEKRMFEGPITVAEARRLGSTHKAYGWSRRMPVGTKDWTQEHTDAYNAGYGYRNSYNSDGAS